MIKILLIITAAVAATVLTLFIIAIIAGAVRWEQKTSDLLQRLESGQITVETTRYYPEQLSGLPDPVRRYLTSVLEPGAPIITSAEVTHRGSFNMADSGDNWKPFRSSQRVVTRRPGFLWNAEISMMPGLKARVHDAYILGEGILSASIGGLVPIMDFRDRDMMARGELMRYFAESAWYPTALLPGGGVQWEAVDDRSARAVLVDGDIEVSLLFRFDGNNLIESVYSDGRERMLEESVELAPWEGRFSDYQRRDGMLIPISGEVLWHVAAGEHPYWRGTIEQISYKFAE